MNKSTYSEKRIYAWAIAIALAIICLIPVYAFDASGNTISAQVSPGIVALSNTSSNALGSSGVAAVFGGGDLAGYLGFAPSQTNETTPPNLVLLSPASNAVRTNTSVNFDFTATDSSGLANCSLFVDTSVRDTIISPAGGINRLQASLSGGLHYWNISCYDTKGNRNQSITRSLRIILASQFNNDTTDLSQVNISNIPNLTIAKSNVGKISFPTNTDLGNVTDLDSHINISGLSISINSAALPVLNKPAVLTIYEVPYDHVVVLKDGAVCPSCTINSFVGGRIVFAVTGFSTYTVTSTSRLEIFDSSDSATVEMFKTIGFYANYSNVSSGLPISSDCEISFNLGGWTAPVSMDYNATSLLHEYYTSFNESDTYSFNVSCTPLVSGFDALSLTDDFVISDLSNGTFVEFNLSDVGSSRFDDSRPAGNSDSVAGNLSELPINIDIASNSWQGFFGNITGDVMLADAAGNKFYDWERISVAGEILATRNSSVDWNSIGCVNSAVITAEDLFINKSQADSDSVNNTFNMTGHPVFLVSANIISGCKSTRTFRGSAQTGFWNVLLADGQGSAVYTGIINADSYNFRNSTSDFELLVPVPRGILQTYYLYLELS